VTRRGRRRAGALLAATLTAAPSGAHGAPGETDTEPPPASPPVSMDESVLARFVGRRDEPVRQFRARRRMRAEGLGREAFMDVLVELDPVTGFRWTVEAEGGSKMIRDRALRGMLEKEGEAHEGGQVDQTALTAANYSLSLEGREPGGLARLRAIPRRREAGLVNGRFFVTPDTADIVRVEGRLARAPSFWIPRVDLIRHFRRIRGHRVVVRIESVAHVRPFGRVRLRIDFDYEMIDGDVLQPARAPAPTFAGAGLERFVEPDPAREHGP